MKKYQFLIIVFAFILFGITGCNNINKENDGKYLSIGAILPLSGSGAAYGKDALKGIEFAVEEINGRDSGLKIKLIVEDDQTSPSKAINAAQKLISTDNIKIIIGPVTSTSTLAVAPMCNKNKIVCISPGASNPQITKSGDYIFRNWISDELEGAAMAEYVYNNDNKRKVAILYINNDYGIGLKNVFLNRFEELGGEIVLEIGYEQDQTDFKTIINKIRNSDVEIIYLPGYYKEMANIIIESKENGLKIPFRSVVTFEEPELLKLIGSLGNGVVYSSPYYDKDIHNDKTIRFIEGFKSKYGDDPGIFAAHGYDAMNIIYSCVVRGGDDSEIIKNCLYNINKYMGVSGETTFDKNGDVIKPVAIKKVVNDNFKLIDVIKYD